MLREGQFDQIYHQHMLYLDPVSVNNLCEIVDLSLNKITQTSFHNGSIRYYISHRNSAHKKSDSLVDYINSKKISGYLSSKLDEEFITKSLDNRTSIRNLVNDINDKKKVIGCVTAPAKGNTILNFCGLTSHDLPFTTEANQLKIGRYTPLSNIKIYLHSLFKEDLGKS